MTGSRFVAREQQKLFSEALTSLKLRDRIKLRDSEEQKSFSEALANGALPRLKELTFFPKSLGDAGLTSFSGALASGALPQLTELFLDRNEIGDAGMKSFSEALARR